MSFIKYIASITAILAFLLGLIQYFFPNSNDFLSTVLPMASSFIDSLTSFTSGLGPIIGAILFYVVTFGIMLFLAGIIYFIYTYLDKTFIYRFKGIYILKGGIKEFDQKLIESFNSERSKESLITKIKEKSEMLKHTAKSNYDSYSIQPTYQSVLFRSTPNLKEQAKRTYNKNLIDIQKLEDLRIRFVKTLISEKTFRNGLKQLYTNNYLLS